MTEHLTTMFEHFFIGGLLIGFTVFFQAICFDYIMRIAKKTSTWFSNNLFSHWKAFYITAVVLAVMMVGIVQMWVWALMFWKVGAIANLHTAVYFSVSSFTTVGYGDIVLGPDWQLLGSIESANGFLLFGWSAAFIFEIVSNLYRRETSAIQNKPE